MTLEQIIQALQKFEAPLRKSGVASISIFGSWARGSAGPDSDVDVAVRFAPKSRINLISASQIERDIATYLGRRVDLTSEPVAKPSLRREIERDRVLAF